MTAENTAKKNFRNQKKFSFFDQLDSLLFFVVRNPGFIQFENKS